LMCYPHHVETNDVKKFPAAKLKGMKAAHERRFSGSDRAMREKLAKLNWAALLGSGLVAGMSAGGIVQQIRTVLDEIIKPAERPGEETKSLRAELLNFLRYAPRGTVTCCAHNPSCMDIAEAFIEIFEQSGWYIERIDGPLRLDDGMIFDCEESPVLMFTVR